jgi:hypothetical protein
MGTGIGYLRSHIEGGQVRAVVRVLGEPGRFGVRLTEGDPSSGRTHEGLHYYASKDVAFAAADALVRHRIGNHECCDACTDWENQLTRPDSP